MISPPPLPHTHTTNKLYVTEICLFHSIHICPQIALYNSMLSKKHADLLSMMERLEGGLEKLKSTAAQVDDLKEKLKAQEVELKQKNEDADALIEKVGVEQEKVGAGK